MKEFRISHRDQVAYPLPSLLPFFWEAKVKTSWVRYRYDDVRTDETVFVYDQPLTGKEQEMTNRKGEST